MQKAILIALVMLAIAAMPGRAQTSEQPASHKLAKVMIGVGAIAVGATVAAKSSQSTTVTSPIGTSETSTSSTTQLVTGLTIVGAGGFLLWDGLRQHEPARPSTAVVVAVGKQSRAVLIRRVW